jgi:hypothetical protein
MEAAQAVGAEAEARLRPLVEGLAGYQGFLELGSSSGNTISITFFDSDENAAAAEPTFDEEMPKALGDLFEGFAGRRISVERYLVVSDSRPA